MAPFSSARYLALGLAITTTLTSLVMSAAVAWQRSPVVIERLLWISIGIIAVLGAHLLLALAGQLAGAVRYFAALLWGVCMVFALYTHASFILQTQVHAGEVRAAAVPAVQTVGMTAFRPQRSLVEIAADQAKLKTELVQVQARRCTTNCTWLRVRRETLAARLEALAVEQAQATRWQVQQDRLVMLTDRRAALRDAARLDPVTARLASWLGVTAATMSLVTALVIAMVIEGIGCLCWRVGLVTADDPPPVTTETAEDLAATQTSAANDDNMTEDPDVARTRKAVQAGEIRPTVKEIRKHLECSQTKAQAIRRTVVSA